MAPPARAMRARAAAAAASSDSGGTIPVDILYEALLRLPAKELCRIRAVCRAWRSITINPAFITAHAARHREQPPLFLGKSYDVGDRAHDVCVVDLAGDVLKRVSVGPDARSLFHKLHCYTGLNLNLALLATEWNRCSVLNLANGALHSLPHGLPADHASLPCGNCVDCHHTLFLLGQVTSSSTRGYKVLRVFSWLCTDRPCRQLFEVCTLNNDGSTTGHSSCWRSARPRRDPFTEVGSGVAVDGVVFFLASRRNNHALFHRKHRPDIVSFDLGREEWGRDLQAPMGSNIEQDVPPSMAQHTLAVLKGSLVLAYKHHQHHHSMFMMDLWFLMDLENGLWVKEYSIQTEWMALASSQLGNVEPMLVLDDGRLVVHLTIPGILIIWDPVSNSFAESGVRHLTSVGIYTGSLLSLH